MHESSNRYSNANHKKGSPFKLIAAVFSFSEISGNILFIKREPNITCPTIGSASDVIQADND